MKRVKTYLKKQGQLATLLYLRAFRH